MIKVHDLRTNRCLQSIAAHDWPRASDAKPTALLYDSRRRRLVTAAHQPVFWPHTCVADERAGHLAPLCAALYNSLFQVVRACTSRNAYVASKVREADQCTLIV